MTKRDREELVYLRPEHLTAEEREARAALLAESADARRIAAELDQLRNDLDDLTDEGPPIERLFARLAEGDDDVEAEPAAAPDPIPPANNSRYWIGLVVAVAAVLLLVPLLRPDPYRNKGEGVVTARVTLEAVAEGPTGNRPLSAGALVRPDERVVFFVTATEPGVLRLTEGTTDLLGAAWRVDAGRHAPGGDPPLSYRPDTPIDGATYGVEWCPDSAAFGTSACVSDGMALQWGR